MLINDIFQEVVFLTQEVIGFGLTSQENQPQRDGEKIFWKDQKEMSQLLRQMSYIDKYKLIIENNNFNFKLLDAAVVQLQYFFGNQGRDLLAHRLAYYPSPNLERYETAPEEYEKMYFGASEFHDLFEKYIVSFPIRFDYTSSVGQFVDIHHPYSHLHLGEIESCRIPVKAPVMPSQFINFILRNFYNTALVGYCNNHSFRPTHSFPASITNSELDLLHINFA